MKKYFLLSLLVLSSCIITFTDEGARCESIPSHAPINFVLPFDSSDYLGPAATVSGLLGKQS